MASVGQVRRGFAFIADNVAARGSGPCSGDAVVLNSALMNISLEV